MGRPCCGLFACQENLQNNRHRFCKTHFEMHNICAIKDCSTPVSGKDSKTCANLEHKEVETANKAKGASLFILRERFRKTQPTESLEPQEIRDMASEDSDAVEWFEVDAAGNIIVCGINHPGTVGAENDAIIPEPCPSKPATGNRVLKAQFGRRRTHNEQTLVRPCGIIYARATMFGTEAVSNFLVGLLIDIRFCNIVLIVLLENGRECIFCPWCQEARAYLLRHELPC